MEIMETIYVLVCYEKCKTHQTEHKHIIGVYTDKVLANRIGKYFCEEQTDSLLHYDRYELLEFVKDAGLEHFSRVTYD